MSGSQDGVFMATEGDCWFRRNREALARFDPTADLPLRLLELYDVRPRRALAVGGANGFRLAALAARHGTQVTVVEASAEAIRDGQARYPAVEFVRSGAAAIPLSEPFDTVVTCFLLSWVDRAHLLRAVAEIDRLLEDGGFLLISDFYPASRLRVPYHHLPGQDVFTFKQDYAALFLASGLYRLVGLLSGAHAVDALDVTAGEDERVGVWLLRKRLREHYRDGSRG